MSHIEKLQFSNYSITWLDDMNENRKSPTSLYPDLTPELIKEYKLEDGVEGSVSIFLLECDNKKAIFDTGFGEEKNGCLIKRLSELKIKPEDIDYIFITHFHLDHIGGLIDKSNHSVFKNAKIYVNKLEYDGWINKMPKDKNELQVRVMSICKEQLVQFDFGETLPMNVKALDAKGHTPGHTCYQKEKLIIIGDLMHGLAFQVDHPEICPVYDMDAKESVIARKRILDYAKDGHLLIGGMHLPPPAFFKKFGDGK